MSNFNNRIEEILNSLDGIKRAEARPFMHTRVMAKLQIEDKSIWSALAGFIAQPVVAISCFIIVIVGNYIIVNKSDDESKVTTSTSAANSATDLLQPDNFILAVNNYEPNQRP